ncbi:MAG: S24 family peptidase [bacterium]
MAEIKINIQDAFKQNLSDGSGCSEAEPFALQVIDDSMEPEFPAGCIIIIDPSGLVQEGAYVFAKDNQEEYIFRQLTIQDQQYILKPLNEKYDNLVLEHGVKQIEGVITQRAGRRRSQHKWYDK